MKYENRTRAEQIFKEIDLLETELLAIKNSGKLKLFSNYADSEMKSYWIRSGENEGHTPQEVVVKKFVNELEATIQGMIDALKKELEAL